ncbi:hypothetical protein VFC49_09315 [Thermococcus sp. SY098]|uniref:hypothetical protein n=1 Tax=Thermococcus sp. SY098 TaxID=3111325 RepID=UPI002D7866F8|nr:hypothetical protein [Thermococcus sp. SY098]WRS52244.1 hypothetical protein VFC49_09315 [Thermococcus sp. SY098]
MSLINAIDWNYAVAGAVASLIFYMLKIIFEDHAKIQANEKRLELILESIREVRTVISELNKKFDHIQETVQNTVGRVERLEEWRNTYNNREQ